MNGKYVMIFSIFTIIVLFLVSGCVANMSSEELQNRLISANNNIDTYSGQMNMDIKMTGADSAGGAINYHLESTFSIDSPNKKMAIIGSMKMEAGGVKQDIDMETYIVDDYVYTKSMNTWIKMQMDAKMWEEQDQVEQITKLIESGSLKQLNDENLNGKSYYVMEIIPDPEELGKMVLDQQQDSRIKQMVDFENAIKSYKAKIWVNKETFVMEKSEVKTVLEIDLNDLDPEGKKTGKLVLDYSTTMTFDKINEPVNINLPEEAKNAQDLSEISANIANQNANNLDASGMDNMEMPDINMEDVPDFDMGDNPFK